MPGPQAAIPRPVPDVQVRINGQELPRRARLDLLEARMHEDVGMVSLFTLQLHCWDESTQALSWVDDPLFALGNTLELSLGYVGELVPMGKGEITGLELDYAAGAAAVLTVTAQDLGHRLARRRETRTFQRMPDSQIVSTIAAAHGLAPDVSTASPLGSPPTREFVMQSNESDLEFLNRRARANGCEVQVEDRRLRFRPMKTAPAPELTLTATRELVDFCPSVSSTRAVRSVEVRGYDPKTCVDPRKAQGLVGQARETGQPATFVGMLAKDALPSGSGARLDVIDDQPVSNAAEALWLARVRLQEQPTATATGRCIGLARLRAGMVVRIEGVGTRFSGPWRITSATHAFSIHQGYLTRFTAEGRKRG
ncbi:phage late control D family protein [Corallococcus sp. 4LFB]|uniref:phage late control D family protein n=1 Tax=Corallococcus sp. 4LFB TaxID=3383249 RepID=UPI003975FC10